MVVLNTEAEAEATRQKLAWLEEEMRQFELNPEGDSLVQQATIRSFCRLITQLKDELSAYEMQQHTAASVKG